MIRPLVHHRFMSLRPAWRCRGEECRRPNRTTEERRSELRNNIRNTSLRPRPPLLCPCIYSWAPSNLAVKLTPGPQSARR